MLFYKNYELNELKDNLLELTDKYQHNDESYKHIIKTIKSVRIVFLEMIVWGCLKYS